MTDFTGDLEAALDALDAKLTTAVAEAADARARAAGAEAAAANLAETMTALAARVAALEAAPEPDESTPEPEPEPDEPGRDLTVRPFRGGAWDTAVPVTPNAERTRALRTGGQLWCNATSNSHPVVRAKASDPLVTVTDTVHRGDRSWPGPTQMQWRIPTDATPAPGDGHLHIIAPDGLTVLETIGARRTAGGLEVGRMHVVDLAGDGMGPMNGTRAYGGSALGGLIRAEDVAAGVIDHPLALGIPASLLHYTSGRAGYDTRGYGTALGYTSPATEQDWDSQYSYRGPIPMGTRVSVARDADLSGLSPEVRMVAVALRDWGGMIVDRTGAGDICFYAEPSVPGSWVAALLGPSWGRAQIMRLLPLIDVA